MEIRRKKIGGNNWELVNEYWETRSAWGHRTTILKNNQEVITSKVRYYNRTWECYTFQSSMASAVNQVIDTELYNFINDFKEKNNITRFKKGQKQEVEKMFKKTDIGKQLEVLKEAIKNNNFDRR